MKPLRVLVVDDEPMMIEIAEGLLTASGFEVLTASDGARALALATEERPDIVLLDVMMPGIDGREVCRRIKTDPSLDGMKVVLNSALREREVDWRDTGADGFREKNVELLGLPDYLRRIAGGDDPGSDPEAD
ncbi:MAG TPA: response regulator [Longimicrobiales bacterium]|nr:response regulator [Longimicrobiales bacterium]